MTTASAAQSMPHQRPPNRPSRIDRVRNGELDAIFEDGVVVWANQALAAGMRFLEIEEPRLVELDPAPILLILNFDCAFHS